MRDDSLDESKWIDFAGTAVHPTLPHCMGPCPGDGGDPGVQDTGLIFLPTRIPGIAPSKLAPRNTLHAVQRLQSIFAVNVPMAFAGYGTTDYSGGDFEYSSSRRIGIFTFDQIQDQQWATWNKGPSGGCYGDSGGPIFVHVGSQQRIVATISDAGDTCTRGGNACARGYQIRSRLDQGHHRGSLSPAHRATRPAEPCGYGHSLVEVRDLPGQ